MKKNEKFWDRIAPRYARQPVADEASYRRKLEITRGYLRPEMAILEFGCGSGSTAVAHAPHVRHVTAIDVSSRMLEIARGKAAAARVSNVAFIQGDIGTFDAPGQSFDAVLGLSILHLLADRDVAIRHVRMLLKPGGVFVSSTACLGESQRYLKPIIPVGRFLGLMPLVRVFTAQELQKSITDAGFEIAVNWRPGKGKAVFIVARLPD